MEQLATSLQGLLSRLHTGELDASAASRYRVEGAVVALRVALGERSDDLVDELLRERD